jgi:hypothetical protein
MTTLGWPGWRSIWVPPKGGKAATIPCRIHAHGTPSILQRRLFITVWPYMKLTVAGVFKLRFLDAMAYKIVPLLGGSKI